eukprot:CAMPEP_0201726000 /NCGR_PEP_ID=MMETSP0593-20130828/9215_1 /ASSEMBLY_ACC=CAM_ASM_000672 /TAXON_ID=267983 /ORGANISM="Skeletonema japonicum, Strain CCMP2506" /LENGTH=385 /DNA_ID=CAMNT_0048217463 /DNA_START=120 /DNA_END=1277 /DNA_ORIENTATION=+
MSLETPHTVNVSPRLPASAMWQVDKTYADGKPKPKRPYTPYNLFYLLERELVVQKINGPPKSNGFKRKHAGVAPREEDQIKPSSRYEGIIMAPYWYDPNMKEKRKHRKTHGMISFKELTGIISTNWATVDKETKDYVTLISELGRKRYKDLMNRFNASQKTIQLQKKHAEADQARKVSENLKKQPPTTKIVHVGTPQKGKAIPVTPDRTMSNLPPIVYEPSPSVANPHGYHHPNLPIMYPHRYGITQLPPPLPPPMPSTMSPNMPPQYQRRPRQFECNRPVKISKKGSNSKVKKDETTSSSCEAKMPHDEALQLSSLPLLDDEFMHFEPDHITEDVFEQANMDSFASPSRNAEDDDILDMIKGDVWNIDMDTFNYDEEPFKFLSE